MHMPAGDRRFSSPHPSPFLLSIINGHTTPQGGSLPPRPPGPALPTPSALEQLLESAAAAAIDPPLAPAVTAATAAPPPVAQPAAAVAAVGDPSTTHPGDAADSDSAHPTRCKSGLDGHGSHRDALPEPTRPSQTQEPPPPPPPPANAAEIMGAVQATDREALGGPCEPEGPENGEGGVKRHPLDPDPNSPLHLRKKGRHRSGPGAGPPSKRGAEGGAGGEPRPASVSGRVGVRDDPDAKDDPAGIRTGRETARAAETIATKIDFSFLARGAENVHVTEGGGGLPVPSAVGPGAGASKSKSGAAARAGAGAGLLAEGGGARRVRPVLGRGGGRVPQAPVRAVVVPGAAAEGEAPLVHVAVAADGAADVELEGSAAAAHAMVVDEGGLEVEL